MYNKLLSRESRERYKDILSEEVQRQELISKASTGDNVHIVYVMNQVGVWGGVKIILQQANMLWELGIKVTIISHFPRPEWYQLKVNYTQIPFGIDLAKGIPNCDLIIATYWDHIHACIKTGIAPVIYFEQGDLHLFDYDNMNKEMSELIYRQFQIPNFIYTVSEVTANLIRKYYDREVEVIHNGINPKVFNHYGKSFSWSRPYLLIMGSDKVLFKGIKDIFDAYLMVKDEYQLDLIWISPTTPEPDTLEANLANKVIVNPSQEVIGELYRGATLFISGSHYESFSLPVLEAMACGCPVVSTRNLGVQEYSTDRVNIRLANIRDPGDLAEKIKDSLRDPLIDKQISQGLNTAEKFSWNKIIGNVQKYYESACGYIINKQSELDDWELFFTPDDFYTDSEYKKFIKNVLNTVADKVQIPVVYDFFEGHTIARWELAAVRKNHSSGKVTKSYCETKILSQTKIHNTIFHDSYHLFINKDYNTSLQGFVKLFQDEENDDLKAVYTKWMSLCLIELERDLEAFNLLSDAIKIYDDYTDLYYLYMLTSTLLNYENNYREIIDVIDTLGDSVNYPEYFVNVKEHIRQFSKLYSE